MKMPQGECRSLWNALSATGNLSGRWLCSRDATVALDVLDRGSTLGGRLNELRGRSVLIATKEQLPTALALIELDGVVRRLILCPPGLPAADVASITSSAAVDLVVTDAGSTGSGGGEVERLFLAVPNALSAAPDRGAQLQSEWILLTSGTTGTPKLVLHTFASLAGAITGTLGRNAVWATFYDIRRYGGLQIFLRAMLGGGSMLLSSATELVADFLVRAGKRRVTHISGTPSHWRRALMSPFARQMQPRYVRLSGEIADQSILDHLRSVYCDADIAHAFASTEAGVAFDVGDGLAGFPAKLIGRGDTGIEMRITDGSLQIKSNRTAIGYLRDVVKPLPGADGFVDTGDMVQLCNGRYYFAGRRDGIINVGGQKVHPEEVEAVINRHPGVRMSLVKTRKSPITGAIVVADVVIKAENHCDDGAVPEQEALRQEILDDCRRALARHKVPATIRFVPSLGVTPSGKLARSNA
jgi:acyl-coenzyme A synthetase/AMP-(fatty) acid ligase